MSVFHPEVRMPAWVALAVVAGAYVVRSAMRGWDFRPDLPWDAVIVVVLLAILGLREVLRRRGWDPRDPRGDGHDGDADVR